MTNYCDCPTPPGGRVECSTHQLAVCRVRNGVPEMRCIDPPGQIQAIEDAERREYETRIWAFTVVTDSYPTAHEIESGTVLETLRAGVYYDAESGTEVRFSMPEVRSEGEGMAAGAAG